MPDDKQEHENLEPVNEQAMSKDELTDEALDNISGGFDPQPDPPKSAALKMNYIRKSGEMNQG
jgi:bacteriocin-like protein